MHASAPTALLWHDNGYNRYFAIRGCLWRVGRPHNAEVHIGPYRVCTTLAHSARMLHNEFSLVLHGSGGTVILTLFYQVFFAFPPDIAF